MVETPGLEGGEAKEAIEEEGVKEEQEKEEETVKEHTEETKSAEEPMEIPKPKVVSEDSPTEDRNENCASAEPAEGDLKDNLDVSLEEDALGKKENEVAEPSSEKQEQTEEEKKPAASDADTTQKDAAEEVDDNTEYVEEEVEEFYVKYKNL